MSRRLALGLTGLLVCASALTACADAQDAVEKRAGDIVSSATSKAASAAQDAARKQLCGIVGDGKISPSEKQRLDRIVNAAEKAGVPSSLTEPARRLASSDTTLPADAVKKAQEECGTAQ